MSEELIDEVRGLREEVRSFAKFFRDGITAVSLRDSCSVTAPCLEGLETRQFSATEVVKSPTALTLAKKWVGEMEAASLYGIAKPSAADLITALTNLEEGR